MELRECPFCGSTFVDIPWQSHLRSQPIRGGDAVSYWIHCKHCFSSGPPRLEPYLAAQAWNGVENLPDRPELKRSDVKGIVSR